MKVLLLNQCFWPDVVATAQQLSGLARALAQHGHDVTVIAGRRGYDDASLRFPSRERWNGIEIIRLPSVSLGKGSRWRRALNFAGFSMAAAARLMFVRRQDAVVVLTSPPLISWLASLFIRLKGGRMVFWVMDLNPDEAVAAGWLRNDSAPAKILAALLKSSLLHANKIIVLDRFMKERIVAKGISAQKIEVLAPLSDDSVAFDEKGRELFRRREAVSEKFVVMYAGNHSPCHPLDTLLEAARELRLRDDVVFVFVGGGSEVSKVKEFARANQLQNILCLPYQPQAELAALLSAADLHIVIMGEGFPGIVHPCKIYNILAIGSPFLYLGPNESHVADIMSSLPDRRQASVARHGQVNALAESINERADDLFSNQSRHTRFIYRAESTLPQLVAQIEAASPKTIYVAQTSVCDPASKPQTEVCATYEQ
jgi:glycosyltransferase involved in cell wall biosynthesis